MDKDNDSKLNLLEFKNGVYSTYKTYVEYESAGEQAPSPEDVFSKLDIDKDRYIFIVQEIHECIVYWYNFVKICILQITENRRT